MEISEKEYYELKEQIRILQEKVDATKPRNDLASLVAEMPIDFINKTQDSFPDFEYYKNTGKAWLSFVQLAKILHTTPWKFHMDKTSNNKPYIRSIGKHETPRKISSLNDEQVSISVQMLNELIPIYNKYFRQANQTILYSDTADGVYKRIYVEKELEE